MSTAPVAQAAGASQNVDNEDPLIAVGRKRQLEKLELDERVAALERMKAVTEMIKADTEKAKVDCAAKKIELYSSLCSNHFSMDDRARLAFKSSIVRQNTISTVQPAPDHAKISGNAPNPVFAYSARFVSINSMIGFLGHKMDMKQIEKLAERFNQVYFRKYHEYPPQHELVMSDGVRTMCVYQPKDQDLLKQEIDKMMAEESAGSGKPIDQK